MGCWLVAVSPGAAEGVAGGGSRAVEMTVSPISTLGGMMGGEIAVVDLTGGAVAVVAVAWEVVGVVTGSLVPRS